MKHLGDITKLNGAEIPPVWVITGGSPCQDLSVAGKRAGLAGARSGLYMEQIRIIKEMRASDKAAGRTDELVRPRYLVWENVPGAFSSNKGEDFRAVLEEAAHVIDEAAVIPGPPNGKWPTAGCIMGSGWSLAWRIMDAQYWGVPQRRRRIALVTDFGGDSAGEILFVPDSLSGNPAESREAGQETARDAGAGAEGAECYPGVANTLTQRYDGSPNPDAGNGANIVSFAQNQRNEVRDLHDRAGSLAAKPGMKQQTYVAAFMGGQGSKARSIAYAEEQTPCLKSSSNGGNTIPTICLQGNMVDRNVRQNGTGVCEEVSYTLDAADRHAVFDALGNGDGKTVHTITCDHESRVNYHSAICLGNGQSNQSVGDKAGALNCMHDQQAVISLDKFSYNCGVKATGEMNVSTNGISPTHGCTDHPPVVCTLKTVRRLTPTECERLQGYPDGWTDIGEWTDGKGKKHRPADSPRYKALGNSIALPQWRYVLREIAQRLPHGAELGSLFDGIGGFPLVWSELNGKESCLWASEIEDFPIAVTKIHFPEEQ